MKTAKAHNDQLTGSVEITSRSEMRRLQNVIPRKNPNLRVIEWKAYPENKPNREDVYEVTVAGREKTKRDFWNRGEWDLYGEDVVAFAELPEPYKEEK